MTTTVALESRDCVACGAPAEWHPDKQALICPFCGTTAPFKKNEETGEVEEIDLVRTLRELPDEQRGWNAEKRSVRCQSCDAISVFDPERAGQNCNFCGSPQLVDYDEIKPPIRPNGVVPFSVGESSVRDSMRRWFAKKWLAPNKFKKRALIDTVKGVYVPYWTFDAHAVCPWTAQSGTYYYETRRVRGSDGKMTTQRVRKVRWRPASGTIEHTFDDHPVPATKGLEPKLLRGLEPFPTQQSKPYAPSFLAGFTVEHYQVILLEAYDAARHGMRKQLELLCARAVPGDTHRALRIFPEFSAETFKLVLVPVWLLSYDYNGKPFQVMLNGATGKIAGRYPKSWWKVTLLVLAGLLALAAIIFFVR